MGWQGPTLQLPKCISVTFSSLSNVSAVSGPLGMGHPAAFYHKWCVNMKGGATRQLSPACDIGQATLALMLYSSSQVPVLLVRWGKLPALWDSDFHLKFLKAAKQKL